jgi:hypothetical protein
MGFTMKKVDAYKAIILIMIMLFITILFFSSAKILDNLSVSEISALEQTDIKNTIPKKVKIDNNMDKVGINFNSLENIWHLSFSKRTIEVDFVSFMSALDFISIYQPMAEQGDYLANYLISTMIWNCLSAEKEQSKSDMNANHINNSKIQGKYLAVYNDFQKCEGFLLSFSEQERNIFISNFQNQAFDFLAQDEAFDIENIDSYPLNQDKLNLYSNFNMGTEGVMKQSIDNSSAVFLELLTKVRDPITLYAAFSLLSNTSFKGGYNPYVKELTSWLLATCSSGYGCKNTFAQSGGDKVFCFNQDVDCFNKTPEELVSALLPGTRYSEILARARTISERIINGEQERLIFELLSTMSPENAQAYKQLQKKNTLITMDE